MERYLKDIPIFADLNDEALKKLASICENVNFTKGEFVFRENSMSDGFYIIKSGLVEVVRESEPNCPKVAELKQGNFFGEMALLTGSPRTAGVRCAENTELIFIKKTFFNNLLRAQPSTLLRIMTTMNQRMRSQLEQKPPTDAVFAELAGLTPKESKEDGRVISIYSAKGGVGKSLMAVNLGTILSSKARKRVLLWDLDLDFGIADTLLNLHTTETFADLLDENENLNVSVKELSKYIYQADSDMRILPAPLHLEQSEALNLSHISQILSVFKKYFDYIIIDTHSSFHHIVITVLDVSDQILFMLSPDKPALRNSQKCLKMLKKLKTSHEKMSIILNQISPVMSIDKKEVEKALDMPVSCFIPNDFKETIPSMNSGIPFVESSGESEITLACNELTTLLTKEKLVSVTGGDIFSKFDGFVI